MAVIEVGTQRQQRGRMMISVPPPTYERLTAIKLEQEEERGRSVTYAEVIEQLLERKPVQP